MRKGFTLIEVLVATTIIAVLISIGIVSYASVNKRSRDARRRSDVEQLRSALEMYRADIGSYPDPSGAFGWVDVSDLTASLVTTGNYMPAIPTDPKSPTLTYRYKASSLYGYCISAALENASSESIPTCVDGASADHNFGAKNP